MLFRAVSKEQEQLAPVERKITPTQREVGSATVYGSSFIRDGDAGIARNLPGANKDRKAKESKGYRHALPAWIRSMNCINAAKSGGRFRAAVASSVKQEP
jgi:hypothetical protein